jgi:hypothetical protein
MKRIITIIATAIVLFFTSAKSQTISDFFQKYSSDDRFEAVNIGKSMLDMAKSSSQGMDKDQQALIENINGVRVLTYRGIQGSGRKRKYGTVGRSAGKRSDCQNIFA